MGTRDDERVEPFVDKDEELYRREIGGLMRVATTLVGPDDAADVVAEAVVHAMTSPAWPRARNPRAYLYRAVVNQSKMHHRATSRRRLRESLFHASTPRHVRAPDPDVDTARLLDRLSTVQRAVVHLVYWEDLSVGATADLLGVSEGTVKQHLFRARRSIRRALDG